MKDDTISKQAVLRILNRYLSNGFRDYNGDWNEPTIDADAINEIKALPIIGAIQIKHGHWVRWHEEVYDSFGVAYVPHCKCSECGMEFDPYIANYMNYCSNCGIKMDRKNDNYEKIN